MKQLQDKDFQTSIVFLALSIFLIILAFYSIFNHHDRLFDIALASLMGSTVLAASFYDKFRKKK